MVFRLYNDSYYNFVYIYIYIIIGTAYERDYFAEQAEYSANNRFSSPDNLNHKHIFLVKVLTGKFTKGDPQYRQAPKINNSETDRSI